MNDPFYKRPWSFVGASYGLGSSRKGAAFGPQAILKAGLVERLTNLGLDVNLGKVIRPFFESTFPDEPKLKHYQEFLEFHKDLSEATLEVYNNGHRPIVVGGDHALSISSINTAAHYLRSVHGDNAEIGVIWVDTHADINTTETTPSGNIHGMPLAVLMGLGDPRLTSLISGRPPLKPINLVYIGLRDVDAGEKQLIKDLNIRAYTMRDIDENGIAKVTRDAFSYLQGKTDGIVVSFDLDVCDPVIAPGVGTPVSGGLTEREAHYIMETVCMVPNLLSVEFVELNPEIDTDDASLQLSLRLLESAFGKTILL
jgi:arginase